MSGAAPATAATLGLAFARQARMCDDFGAPFYGELCRRIVEDARHDGPVSELMLGLPLDPVAASLPLRLLAGVHALVLAGRAPELAAHYPPLRRSPSSTETWRQFAAIAVGNAEEVRTWFHSPPQTNEVGRSGALLPGFLIAARAGLPLRLLEPGASAGLNLRWDRYRYETADWSWGNADAGVVLRPRWRGPVPELHAVTLAERRGCDVAPLDPRDPATVLRLCAYVWPDRQDRMANLRASLALAARDGLAVERADAAAWLARALAAPMPETATVVFHSSFWCHIPPATQARIADAMAAAGARATARAPLHWLRWEDEPPAPDRSPGRHELRMWSWPGGEDRLLAIGQPHGDWIDWLA
jgi:hypothetical protein